MIDSLHSVVPPTDSLNILYVEDDQDDFEIFLEALQTINASYTLTCIKDGDLTLNWLAGNRRPDLIFLDINMPRLSGKEVLKQLKADKAYSDIPVLICTGSKNDYD